MTTRARTQTTKKKTNRNTIQIPATDAGIDAAARLQREDGINVNLTFVSGVMHAAACVQAGPVAVTLPIAKVCFFFIPSRLHVRKNESLTR
jgi:transaldolase